MESSSSSKEDEKPAKLLERIKSLVAENKKLKEKLGRKMNKDEEDEKSELNPDGEGTEQADQLVCTCKEGPSIMAAVDDFRKSFGTSLDKISSGMKKMMEDSVDQKYEAEAIAIEKEENWKREMEKLMEKFKQLLREREDRLERMTEERHETVSTAITALQESVDNISTRMEKIEEYVEKQNNQTKIPQWVHEEGIQSIGDQMDKNTILIFGGEAKLGWFSDAVLDEIYMLSRGRNRWIKLTLKLPKAFAYGGAVYLDGAIYIFGGSLGKELYKWNKKLNWKRLSDMNEKCDEITSSCLGWNGSIWVFGGWDGKKALKSVERYDPKEDKWLFMPDMNYPRSRAAAAVWNGKFIVCGGRDGSNPLKSVECFDPESGVWTEMNDMPTPCNSHCLAPYGNSLFLMGGKDERLHHDSVFEVSHLEGNGAWKELSPMKYFRSQFAVATLDGEIFVIGGFDRAYMDKTEIFVGGSWRDGPALHYPCSAMSSVVIPPELANVLNYTDNEINS